MLCGGRQEPAIVHVREQHETANTAEVLTEIDGPAALSAVYPDISPQYIQDKEPPHAQD